MGNYLLVFHGGSMPEGETEQKQVMQAWTDWFGTLDGALKDPGNPTAHTKHLSATGSVTDDASGPSGYTILSANSIDRAVELARGCPVLAGGASIQVAEILEVM